MLVPVARAAVDFYWMGRYLERTEHTARLLEYQLTRLVDTPADQLALGWRVVYKTLGHSAPQVSMDADEVERLQHQAVLLDTWVRVGQPSDGPRLSWSDLLRVCRAY